jgi:hypothetical protein
MGGTNGSAIGFGQTSKNDTIIGNQIENNKVAISTFNVVGCEEFNKPSAFYHNNFVNNSRNLFSSVINTAFAVNFWDNGTIGNYWSNYNGTDANSDGLGDTPYFLDLYGNQDNHPLMAQVNISEILSKMLPTFNLEIPEYPLPSPSPSPSPTATPSPSPSPSPSSSPEIPEFPYFLPPSLVVAVTVIGALLYKKRQFKLRNRESKIKKVSYSLSFQ